MRFCALGPLSVSIDEVEVSLGGPKQRLLLALLLQADGRTVPLDRLIAGLWLDDPPRSARSTLQVYIHHLRKQLGDALITVGNGYALDTHGAFDVMEFEEMRQRAVTQTTTDPEAAADELAAALALWRGPAYADLQDELALTPEIRRLEELRIVAIGDRIDAALAAGNHVAIISELESLVEEFPLRERFRAQHMTALYRSGRKIEALRSFERGRRSMIEQAGLEPSRDLRALEQQILDNDPALEVAPARTRASTRGVRGYELREVIDSGPGWQLYRGYQRSMGRQVAVRVFDGTIADAPSFIAGFREDVARLASVDHPSIAYILDVWREPGHAYQVHRWFGGGTLASRLGDHGAMAVPAALATLDAVGSALAAAHRDGVIHGRLSPHSVVFDDSDAAYVVDFAIGTGVNAGDAAGDLRDLAVVAYTMLAGTQPPLRSDGSLDVSRAGAHCPPALVEVVAAALDGESPLESVMGFLREMRRAAGVDVVAPGTTEEPEPKQVRNPFKGLRPFQESDAGDFFGRDELVDRILQTIEIRGLVAVVGPSGSGKSSLVKAGVVPRLRGLRNGTVLIADMYPGTYPFEELEAALHRVSVKPAPLIEELLADERGLVRVLKDVLPDGTSKLLLVIDQAEELFSPDIDEGVRRLFLTSIVRAVTDTPAPLEVIFTLRADYFGQPMRYPELAALVDAGLVPVGVPDHSDLVAAIVQPARAAGLEFEPGLVRRIVDDVAGQPGGLPLFQYALTELVEHRDSVMLTAQDYEDVGGVTGALAARAESLYGQLDDAGKNAIRQAFLRMVTVDESGEDLRRRVRRSDLRIAGIPERTMSQALGLFGAHRMLTFDLDPATRAPTIEVAHEELLRQWDRLASWVDAQRDSLLVRRRLDLALAEWESSEQDPAFLLAGGRLEQAEAWLATPQQIPTTAEKAFVEASRRAADEAERRRSRARRRTMLALSAAAVIFAVLGIVAWVQARIADDQAAEATMQRLTTQAIAALEEDPDLAILLALEAYDRAVALGEVPGDVMVALQRTTQTSRLLLRHPEGSGTAAMSPDGSLVALGATGDESQIILVDVDTGEEQSRFDAGGEVLEVAFSPDGALLAVAFGANDADGDCRFRSPFGIVIDVATADPVMSLEAPWCFMRLAFSPDGRFLMADAGLFPRQPFVTVWDVTSRLDSPLRIDGFHRGGWLPDGRSFVMFERGGTAIRHIDVADGSVLLDATLPEPAATVAVSPAGNEMLVDFGDRLERWEADASAAVGPIAQTVPAGDVHAWYSQSGDRIFAAGQDDEVRVIPAGPGEIVRLRGHPGAVFQLSASGNGQRLVTAPVTGSAFVWDLSPTGPPELGNIPTQGDIWAVEFAAGRIVVTEDLPDTSRTRAFDAETMMDLGETVEFAPLESALPAADGGFSVGLATNGSVIVRQQATGEVMHEVEECGMPVAVAEDGSSLLLTPFSVHGPCRAGAAALLVDPRSGAVLAELPLGLVPRLSDIGPPGTISEGLLATQNRRENTIELVDLASGSSIWRLSGDGTEPWRPFFSQDGRWLSFGSALGGGFAVDVEAVLAGTPVLEAVVTNPQVAGGPTTFSVAGAGSLVTGHSGELLRFWDLGTGEEWMTLPVATGNSTFLAFDPDERYLFYEDAGGVMRRFPLDPSELAAVARARVQRDFTGEECVRYLPDDECGTRESAEAS